MIPTGTAASFVVLIPAYEPGPSMIVLIDDLRAGGHRGPVVIVDDGSGEAFADRFAEARARGCEVITHPVNRGKGAALKTGFAHIRRTHPGAAVVCADCDGQHAVDDICRVARELEGRTDTAILGARHFAGAVPARSRFGNTVTRVLFARSTGLRLQDTQTGLRGYPAAMLPWLGQVPGDRFEYELSVLLEAEAAGFALRELPISTIYLDGNRSTHFRTFADSARVYAPLLRFSLSSLAAFAIDFTLVLALDALSGSLLAAVATARLCSATVNFLANRRYVFGRGDGGLARSWTRYALLATAIATANYLLLALLHERLGVALVAAKLLVEVTLFLTSYQVQKRVVFRRDRRRIADTEALGVGRAMAAPRQG
ncbi:MAG: bifunctional glycosyltransferase family 2/GtrA family protein [Acidimicrobiales bacterium]